MCNGVYATELFIKVAAVLLQCNSYITAKLCTEAHPHNIITLLWGESDHSSSSYIFTIGNLSGIHFQSLIFLEEVAQFHSNIESLPLLIKHQIALRPQKTLIILIRCHVKFKMLQQSRFCYAVMPQILTILGN